MGGDEEPSVTTDSGAAASIKGDHPGTGPTAHRSDRSQRLLLALVLAVAAAVRLVGIGKQPFSIDEISEIRIAHLGVADILTFDDGIPPLYNSLLHVVLPFGDVAGRVLSAVFGVGTVAVTWFWARRVAGFRVGLLAAWLIALSPFVVHLSAVGRADSLAMLLAATSLWLLWVALDDSSTLRWVCWGVVSAVGIYSHYLFALVIAAGLIVAFVEVRGRPGREMWFGLGVLGVLAAPVLAILSSDLVIEMRWAGGPGLRPLEMMYSGYTLLAGFSLGPPQRELHYLGAVGALRAAWFWIALAVPVVGALLVLGQRALDRAARQRLLVVSLCGLLLMVAAVAGTGYAFDIRHLPWLAVPLAIWLAAGLVHLRTRWRRAAAGMLLVVAVCAIVGRYASPCYQVDDFGGVAAYLKSSGALNHPVLVLGVDRTRPIVYYIDRPAALALPDYWDPDIGRLDDYSDEQLGLVSIPPLEEGFGLTEALTLVDASTKPAAAYYLIYTLRAFELDPQGELLRTLAARDGLVLAESFAGLDVYRGVRAG